jgi:hypothetical protein
MEWKLELVPVPVCDVDRAKAFYNEKAGFNEDHDVRPTDEMRIVQLTPPGSACSIVLGIGILDLAAGLRTWPSPRRLGHRRGACGACRPRGGRRRGPGS